MLARIFSCAVIGLEGVIVEVEVDTAQGLPGMDIVGLPDAAVQESRQRVLAAIKNSGYPYPRSRLTITLAPASVRKEGPAYDLPIALGILACMEMIPVGRLEGGIAVAGYFVRSDREVNGDRHNRFVADSDHLSVSLAPIAGLNGDILVSIGAIGSAKPSSFYFSIRRATDYPVGTGSL